MKCIMSGSDLAILQDDIFFLYCLVIVFSRCFKGQLISKANCQPVNSSKKGTNEFIFTTMRRVFRLPCFWCLQIYRKTNKFFARISALVSKKRSNQKNKGYLVEYSILLITKYEDFL